MQTKHFLFNSMPRGFLFGLLTITVAFTGCATRHNYTKATNSWLGVPAQALTHQWGPPTRIVAMPNHRQWYIYQNETMTHQPIPMMRAHQLHPGRISPQTRGTLSEYHPQVAKRVTHTFHCETIFEVNRHGMIVNTKIHGDGCETTHRGMHKRAF